MNPVMPIDTMKSSEPLSHIEGYQQEAYRMQSDVPWVRHLQQKGSAEFQRLGFPGRREEDWRYTSVDPFLKHAFSTVVQTKESNDHALEVLGAGRQTDVPVGVKLACINGVVIGLDTLHATLPPGVLVMTLLDAMHQYPEHTQPYLDTILKTKHGFHAQNTAMLECGLFIYVPAHVCISEPILLVHWQTQAFAATYLRHLIVAETGAEVTLIEDYQGAPNIAYYTNTITELYVAPKAKINHYKMQRESHLAFHVGHLAVQLTEGASVESHVFSLGGRWSRSDVHCDLSAPQSSCTLNGLYVPGDQQHMDHHTWVYHDAPDCISVQDYKGILTGKSRAVFNGQVHVAPFAQKTVAKQQNKNLLLSKQAEIDTKPQLDIAADDVLCTHGATVGQLDEEALFYFATRGITERDATQYLIQAFAIDNLKAMGHDALTAWMIGLLYHHLGTDYES